MIFYIRMFYGRLGSDPFSVNNLAGSNPESMQISWFAGRAPQLQNYPMRYIASLAATDGPEPHASGQYVPIGVCVPSVRLAVQAPSIRFSSGSSLDPHIEHFELVHHALTCFMGRFLHRALYSICLCNL